MFGRKKLFLVWHPAAGAASVGGERKIQAIIVLSFDRWVCFFNEYPWEAKRSAIMADRFALRENFSRKSIRKKEKSTVSFTHKQNIILFAAKHCWMALHMSRPLFAGHVVGSRPMKRKKNLLRMMIIIINQYSHMVDFPKIKKSNLISSGSG